MSGRLAAFVTALGLVMAVAVMAGAQERPAGAGGTPPPVAPPPAMPEAPVSPSPAPAPPSPSPPSPPAPPAPPPSPSSAPVVAASPPAPASRSAAPALELPLYPFLVLVGGLDVDQIVNRPAEDGMVADERQSRLTTLSLARFGLEARVDEHVSARSEIELAAGPHGTSVWEGQAAMTVRDQYLRLDYAPLRLDVGRITDPASIDFYARHVANTLLTDPQLRIPFLASGANRGNGVLVAYTPRPGLTLGLTLNAGNPVSTTGTAMLGGTYPPFSRFYFNIIATVRESATRFPSDLFHAVLASPSVTWRRGAVHAQLSYQYVWVDVTTADRDNPAIQGHNVRGGVALSLAGGRVRPFVNGSYLVNDVIAGEGAVPDTSRLADELFHGLTAGVGADVELSPRLGIGAQYNLVDEQQGDSAVFTSHFANVGATWRLHPRVALQARWSLYLRCQDSGDGCDVREHQHNYFLTLLGSFGGAPAAAAASF